MTVLFVVAGLALLFLGAEILVRGSARSAAGLGVSPLLIGLVLVGFGTSTPELVASLVAAAAGSPGIALGNVVGSNIANVLLILGIAGVLIPLRMAPARLGQEGGWLAGATLVLLAAALAGAADRLAGAAFVALLLVYVVLAYRRERRRHPGPLEANPSAGAAAAPAAHPALLANLALALAGLAGVLGGAWLLVEGAIAAARVFGVSETVIGLTIVAVGTSLPELATSVVAALRRQPEIAVGNIVGSNIFNALGITGATALYAPFAVPAEIAGFHVWVMLAATVVLIGWAELGRPLGRAAGITLVAAYVLYLGVLVSGGWHATL